jgi:CRP-like cAMP-binding protein
MLRYVQAQLVQAAQSAACNAKHNIEQRLARWLLLCTDRARTETLKLSQEFLADMLGSTRPTVSIAAGTLKEEGLIDYNRGVILILDAKHLEERACECYHVIKDYLESYSDLNSTFIS